MPKETGFGLDVKLYPSRSYEPGRDVLPELRM